MSCYTSCNQLLGTSGHSTETALIKLTDQILTNMDNDELTGLLFILVSQSF